MRRIPFFTLLALLSVACKEESTEEKDMILIRDREKVKEKETVVDTVTERIRERVVDTVIIREQGPSNGNPSDGGAQGGYDPNTVDDQLAKNVANFLTREHLKKDMSILSASDRKFQMYKIDLNGDGKKEVFVRFMSPYFCGSGGCKLLLLDDHGDVITDFSVTRTPVWVEPTKKNGWRLVLLRSGGELRELSYANGTYPSNPSIVAKAPYDAASGSAVVMFDDNFSKAKTYTF